MSAAETWLTIDEVAELTDRVRWKAQCRMLSSMGIRFQPNAVGRPLVERSAVLSKPTGKRPAKGPNWEALNGKAA